MGDKIEAKKIAKELGLPIIKGSDKGITNLNEAKKLPMKLVTLYLLKLRVEVVVRE